jgi:hypothetical protein
VGEEEVEYDHELYEIMNKSYLSRFIDLGFQFALENPVTAAQYHSIMGSFLITAIRLNDENLVKIAEDTLLENSELFAYSSFRKAAHFCLLHDLISEGRKYLSLCLDEWGRYLDSKEVIPQSEYNTNYPSFYHELKHTIKAFEKEISDVVFQKRDILLKFVDRLDVTDKPVHFNLIAEAIIPSKQFEDVREIMDKAEFIRNSEEFMIKSSYSETLVELKAKIGIAESDTEILLECISWLDTIKDLYWTDLLRTKITVIEAFFEINDNENGVNYTKEIIQALQLQNIEYKKRSDTDLTLIFYTIYPLAEVLFKYNQEKLLIPLIDIINHGINQKKDPHRVRGLSLLTQLGEVDKKGFEELTIDLLEKYKNCLHDYDEREQHESRSELISIIRRTKDIYRELEDIQYECRKLGLTDISQKIEENFQALKSTYDDVFNRLSDPRAPMNSSSNLLSLYKEGKRQDADELYLQTFSKRNIEPVGVSSNLLS